MAEQRTTNCDGSSDSDGARPLSFVEIAVQPCVVRRALILAGIVGTVLIGINHGDCIMKGHFAGKCWIQSGLTLLVPYCVSTISSVLAYSEQCRRPE